MNDNTVSECLLDPIPIELMWSRPASSRAEPVSVAKDLDDFTLGVKGQSSSEIAGFPRNLFR